MTRFDRRFAAVVFDETAWSEDLRNATDVARAIATRTRRRLEREGQPIDALLACDAEASDGTSLPGCVKAYIPPPAGRWGLVYLIARNQSGRLRLDHVAFGVRHPPRGRRASVYQIAHQRLRAAPCKPAARQRPVVRRQRGPLR